jgi:hypothetical protein
MSLARILATAFARAFVSRCVSETQEAMMLNRLTPSQAAICAAVFVVTACGALLLAWWFVRSGGDDGTV